MVDKIDALVLEWINKDVHRYFKNAPKDISSLYKSLRKEATKEGYANTLLAKCTITSTKASFRCWDGDKNPMTVAGIKDIEWPNFAFACQVTLKGLYFQSNSFGPLLEVTSVMVRAEDATCPFAEESD